METELRDLVVQAQQGDSQAYAAIVKNQWRQLLGFARSILGDLNAEDTVQDALIVAWNKLGALKSPDAFHPWLMRILARRCYRQASSWKRFLPLAGMPDVPDQATSSDQGELAVEMILKPLSARQRAVMYLTVVEGMSDSEIGETLGIDAASVRSHRQRARQALQHRLSPAWHSLKEAL